MILEKEIKILEIDRAEVEKKLLSLGAKKIFDGFIHDVYYDFLTDGDEKNKLHANKRMFRVRKKGEEHIYTIKNKRTKIGKQESVVAKDEHEMKITDVKSFASVLERYGMEKIREKKKHRVSYNIGEIEFDFDLYEGIPELLEIEGPSGDVIREWIEKLELNTKTQFLGGSKKLFEYYGVEYSYF